MKDLLTDDLENNAKSVDSEPDSISYKKLVLIIYNKSAVKEIKFG